MDLIDGTSLAQLSYPDMRAPIANALTYPGERLKEVIARLDYNSLTGLSFFPLLPKRFPLFGLAKRSLSAAGAMPAIYNAANEFAVNAFMHKRISFDKIVGVCDTALTRFDGSKYRSLEELLHLIDLVNIFLSEKI
ncbi:MAG: hypothetical protein DCC75_08655 [Proteobacteria bacterium]|nr:MAG: hypothetical protein DCC75_08655 [Pseudomonadota bacterium]